MDKSISFRPIGPVRTLVETVGLTITYAYEDLVFVESNAFILRFDDADQKNLFFHPNIEAEKVELDPMKGALSKVAKTLKLKITPDKPFEMLPNSSEDSVNIAFK